MENNFQYTKCTETERMSLQARGFTPKESAIFDTIKGGKYLIINHEAQIYWAVDQLAFDDAQVRVLHLTGKNIEKFQRTI